MVKHSTNTWGDVLGIKKLPHRMCLGCMEMHPKKYLIRLVKEKEGKVSIDFLGIKPGRGAYLCPKTECMQKAVKQKKMEKAFGHLESNFLEDLALKMEDVDAR
jgi:uncharacterized protein